ncbi:uncharacterized protein PHALS_03427 [Plasmopara halstedii]|uniref:No apical meristem-associated C-terminal domain-containing protein n=1 Tax=Plasmopara halstedii TaxID=4781 RepID=A0A0P1AYE6_PLAHL|nr:uncharacterized protein PHALS_03427 [Plasmopara halstedii]CEG46743.1 hypothetical protein PHALS_03427 [Plasmopara halstedii]|eukprot:XP_024583112.1 hypothetical protein PHALS_03427 [Plasmopara halstedii]
MPSGSESVDLLNLARAWITVASNTQPEQDDCVFWKRVESAYATNVPPTNQCWTIDMLQKQWKAMRPAMVAFVTLFSQRYKKLETLGDNVRQAFEWAIKTFRAATKKDFEFVSVAWLLVNQTTWWMVLKPRLMHQFASMHEEDETQEQQEKQQASIEVSQCTTRSSSADDRDQSRKRHIKQRGEFKNCHSLPSAEDFHRMVDEQKSKDMAQVMERRLELDIMTQSEVGLSPEAKEYLVLQRQLILQRLKKKIKH